MRDAWSFAPDTDHWMPLVNASRLDERQRSLWLDGAVARLTRANRADSAADVAAARAHAEQALAGAPDGDACVFFPVMIPSVVTAHIDTVALAATAGGGAPADEWSLHRAQWLRSDASTAAVESVPVAHEHLVDAERIMRADRRGDHVEFSVAFLGRAADAGVVLWMRSRDAMEAGQFSRLGEAFFTTFDRRGGGTHA